jgi:mRNA-degrading endonuclease RelE of RelBE toxin-antitoxin system
MLRYSLKVHKDATADIEKLWESAPQAAAAIVALLEQAESDQRLLESLTIKDFGVDRTEPIHVDWWWTQYKEGRNLWRVKIWNLESRRLNYRIVYALDPRSTRYYVLGVLPRDFNYDQSNPRARRLLAAYDELGIPRY